MIRLIALVVIVGRVASQPPGGGGGGGLTTTSGSVSSSACLPTSTTACTVRFVGCTRSCFCIVSREERFGPWALFASRIEADGGSDLLAQELTVSVHPMQADGSASYSSRSLSYSSTTGIFTGTMVTNQCNAYPRKVNGVQISLGVP